MLTVVMTIWSREVLLRMVIFAAKLPDGSSNISRSEYAAWVSLLSFAVDGVAGFGVASGALKKTSQPTQATAVKARSTAMVASLVSRASISSPGCVVAAKGCQIRSLQAGESTRRA